MKVKRMVKRLFAVGAGAAMLGATAMGAMAADLSNYPDAFVTDGAFDGYFVVGENAKAIDNLAAIDIATINRRRREFLLGLDGVGIPLISAINNC